MPSDPVEPLFDCPRCADANNVQLDITRWRRRHHKVMTDA